MTLKIGSLFSGYGGLDMAVESAFDSETAWTCEFDEKASAILAHSRPPVPNYGDVTLIDWGSIEPIDILTGGYPCQPFSLAGRREGENDPRHMWPYVREAIRALRPKLVFLENVTGHRSLGFDRVLGDMAEDGLHAWWCCVRASDVGAPHVRDRLFILACPEATLADASSIGLEAGRRPSGQGTQEPRPDSGVVPLSVFGRYADAVRRWERVTGNFAPSPTAFSRNGKHQLSPEFAEWTMGLPPGHISSAPIPRAAMIRAAGNGVCPQQAEFALRHLFTELERTK